VRLRPLTEAECYARCYGGRNEESVQVLRPRNDQTRTGAAPDRLESPDEPEKREAA
jgi:hypothetical protein